jgi:hypothetical protein
VSLAYYYNIGQKYKKSKLDISGLPKGRLGYTVTNELEIEDDSYEEGSNISYILHLRDPFRNMLNKAKGFRDATHIAAHYCSL